MPLEAVQACKEVVLEEIGKAADATSLESLRITAVGKSGLFSQLKRTLGRVDPRVRAERSQLFNQAAEEVEEAAAARKFLLETAALEQRLATERLDLSLPVEAGAQGSIHPVSQVMDELAEIFADLGFSVETGPEIEDDWHNFTALNIPESHPARAMHDTFYFGDNRRDSEGRRMLLRTHTSPVQIARCRARNRRST